MSASAGAAQVWSEAVPWLEVAAGSSVEVPEAPLAPRRVYLQVGVITAVVVLAVALLGAGASRRVAEREAVNDAAQRAGVLADAVVQPALLDGVQVGDRAALDRLDAVVRAHVLDDSIVRVKFWTADGRIVYSDESRLIGDRFPLGEEELAVLANPQTRAEVSDLDGPENRFETGRGKLLEVYRPVRTPAGEPLLFETYARYDAVTARSNELWRGFAGITLTSLLMLVVLLMPVLWRLLDRLHRAQGQREAALARAVEASDIERQRIAATLHDGVVQELVATSYVVSGAALRAQQGGQPDDAESLQQAAQSVRTSIGGLRSLLVDIYPASLDRTGLAEALTDLAAGPRSRHIAVDLTLPEGRIRLAQDQERLIYRVAQECLRNAVRHSAAQHIALTLGRQDDLMVLEVTDDGTGFDADAKLTGSGSHFGLRLLVDAVARGHGRLLLATRPGAGCRWRLEVPDR